MRVGIALIESYRFSSDPKELGIAAEHSTRVQLSTGAANASRLDSTLPPDGVGDACACAVATTASRFEQAGSSRRVRVPTWLWCCSAAMTSAAETALGLSALTAARDLLRPPR